MSADWMTCLVVRDRDGALWGRVDGGGWMLLGVASFGDEWLGERFGPLDPVLDADGLPAAKLLITGEPTPFSLIEVGDLVRRSSQIGEVAHEVIFRVAYLSAQHAFNAMGENWPDSTEMRWFVMERHTDPNGSLREKLAKEMYLSQKTLSVDTWRTESPGTQGQYVRMAESVLRVLENHKEAEEN